jgi:hypothetical protein
MSLSGLSYMIRILISILIVISLFFLPWWFTALMLAAGIIFLPFYIEAILISLASDFIFGIPDSSIPFLMTILSILLIIAVDIIKTRTRFGI